MELHMFLGIFGDLEKYFCADLTQQDHLYAAIQQLQALGQTQLH